ncbi:unnamed protein product [Orchesella dallaii]|uniref:Major facilitator superfamily (MFS) profile domain-containing protein n=1 Tax=Orchesella dallaii TaxID=48710 RepID=A0ABP1RLM5_9HEXA
MTSQQKENHSLVNPSHIPQYLACGILSLGGILGGTVPGWSSTALPSIQSSNHFPGLNKTGLSWIASIATLGCLIGSPTGGYLIRKIGRKNCLLFSSTPYLIGWVALAFPLKVWMLYVGRFLTGIGLAVMVLTGSVYLSEIAAPELSLSLRGRLSVAWFVAIRLGILFKYGVGSILPYNHLSAISAILSIVFGASIFYLPESPRWLISEGRREDAIESLCWLQASDKKSPSSNILAEIQEPSSNPVLIATSLMIFKDACGGNTFSFFVVQTFDKTGSAFNSHVSGVIIGVAQLVGILVTVFCVDTLGRRILLITSFIIMSLSMAILGLFQQFKTDIDGLSQYSGEIIPTNVIGSVSGLVTGIGWMTCFIFTRSYQDMNDGIGVANTFWVFAVFSAVGGIFTHVFVPETVGRRLENIHEENSKENDIIEMKQNRRAENDDV